MEKKSLIFIIGNHATAEKIFLDYLLTKLPDNLKITGLDATNIDEVKALHLILSQLGKSAKKLQATLVIYAGTNLWPFKKSLPCDNLNLAALLEGLKTAAGKDVSADFIQEAATGAIIRMLGLENNREATKKIRYSLYCRMGNIFYTEYPEHSRQELIDKFISYLNSEKARDIIIIDHESLTVELRRGRIRPFSGLLEEEFEGWKKGQITSLGLKENRYYLKK